MSIRFINTLKEKVLYLSEGIPVVEHFGEFEGYNYMAMTLLGPSIDEQINTYHSQLSLKCILQIAIQMVILLSD